VGSCCLAGRRRGGGEGVAKERWPTGCKVKTGRGMDIIDGGGGGIYEKNLNS
jgi:hypothetical protein